MTHSLARDKDINTFTPRQRVLAAGLKLFVDQGYFNTNIPDLSRESKCSVGSIYHIFKCKEQVARELYEEAVKSFRINMYNQIEDIDEIEELIKSLVFSILSYSQANTQISKYIWLSRHDEFLNGLIKHPTRVGFDPLGRKITKITKLAIKNGEINKIKAHILWSIIFGMPLSYIRDWLEGYNTVDPIDVSREIGEVCWKAIKA